MRRGIRGRHRVDPPEPLLDAREIRRALCVDVTQHLRDPQRQLALLT